MPPEVGLTAEYRAYACELSPTTTAAARNTHGKTAPEISATCPTRAKMPAPIMTPVPSDTEPMSEILWSSRVMGREYTPGL